MEERRSDVPCFGRAASRDESERKTWETPSLAVLQIADVTLGDPAYYSDGLDGS